MKRELDYTNRPVPQRGEILDSYIDRYFRWLETELLAIMNDTIRRRTRRRTRRSERAHRLTGNTDAH